MKPPRQRLSSEVIKRGYSDEEIAHLYELARFSLETGETRRAELIATGLVEVAPEFEPGWLCLATVHLHGRAYEAAIGAAKQAHQLNPDSVVALLLLVTASLATGDYNSAGTFLGEVGERIDAGAVEDQNALRFYRAQLARFQAR